jgi:hypothetical protein
MFFDRRAFIAVCSTAAITLLVACAGGVSSPPASSPSLQRSQAGAGSRARVGSWASANAKQHVYVADPSLDGYYGAVCYYGAKGGAQLGCLAGGASSTSSIGFPQGTWVDPAHHLGGKCSGPEPVHWTGHRVCTPAHGIVAADEYALLERLESERGRHDELRLRRQQRQRLRYGPVHRYDGRLEGRH